MGKLYTENSIESLSPLEFTRLRPGVYAGDTTYATQLLVEIFSNCIDEFRAGHGNKVEVTINGDVVTVRDYGQGFIAGAKRDDGKTVLEAAFSVLNTSGKFREDGSYEGTSLGSFGIGSKITTFLSHWLEVRTWRDGRSEEIHFKEGVVIPESKSVVREQAPSGTFVKWQPSEEFFTNTTVEISKVREIFHVTSCLCPGLTINLNYNGKEETFLSENGLKDLADKDLEDNELISNRLVINYKEDKYELDLILTYTTNYSSTIIPYVNTGLTSVGSHISQLKTCLTREFNNFFREKGWLKDKDDNLLGDDIQEGLYVVFNYTAPNVSYDAQVKSTVTKIECRPMLTAVIESLNTWMRFNEKELKSIADKAVSARKAREAAKKAREAAREKAEKKSKPKFTSKLAECYSKDRTKCEIYITEGDSASGNLKTARNNEFQAVMPVRGKILNCWKASFMQMQKNQEVMTMIEAFGLELDLKTMKVVYDPKKLRYDKIIILSDADVDGCFSGDTKIKSLDGNTYTFEELVNNNVKSLWVYSKDEQGNLVPGFATNPHVTKEVTELVELEFENGFKIRCTPDHRILLNSGEYVEAQDLTTTDSISSIYMKNSNGYLEYTVGGSEWKWLHHTVNDAVNTPTTTELVENIPEDQITTYRFNDVVVHHKDHNPLNNQPENLQAMYTKEHGGLHLKEYNVSQLKKDRFEAHKNDPMYWENYIAPRRARVIEYNKSEKHKQEVAAANRDPKNIMTRKIGSVAGVIAYMLDKGLEVNEQTYTEVVNTTHKGCYSWSKVVELANGNIEEFINSCKDHSVLTSRVQNYNTDQKFKQQIANIIWQLRDTEFTKETYMAKKKELHSRAPKYETILNYFDSYEEAYNWSVLKNHKVKSVTRVLLEQPIKVYDLTVDKYHNFMISTSDDDMEGIFVHNCHIKNLFYTFIWTICPQLIIDGHIYAGYPPLYKISPNKDEHIFLKDDAALEEYRQQHKNEKYILNRFKGLGEMTPEDSSVLVDPQERTIKQITVKDVEEANALFESLMGNDASSRTKYIEEHSEEANIID